MQSYLKAAALASVAVTLHGCGPEETKPAQVNSAGDFLAKLDADKIQGAVKVQAKQFLKMAQFKAAASEMIAAASAAADQHGSVDAVVNEAMKKLDSAEGCANTAVKDAVEQLHAGLKKLNISDIDTQAHKAFEQAMGEGKNVVMQQLAALNVDQKQIDQVASNLEKLVREKTGIELHTHNAVATGLELLNKVVQQGKGYENQVQDFVKHINIADHMASVKNALPIHGENMDTIESQIHAAIQQGADTVQDGLGQVQSKAKKVMADRATYVAKANKIVAEAQSAVNKAAK